MLLNVLVFNTASSMPESASATRPAARPSRAGTAVAEALAAAGLVPLASPTDDVSERDSITVESVRRFEGRARARAVWERYGLTPGDFVLILLRRATGDDDPEQLRRVASALSALAGSEPMLFPANPATRARLAAAGSLDPISAAGVRCIDPLRYLDLLSLKTAAGAVLTDSGRVVEEARVLGVPCFPVRTELEAAHEANAEVEALVAATAPIEPVLAPPAPGAARRRRLTSILGVEIDDLDMAETVAACEELIHSEGTSQHVCINVAKLMQVRHDDELRQIVRDCSLVSADGQPIVWASRVLGVPLPERVAGIDLMYELLALSARTGLRPFFLGARPEVLDVAMRRLREQFPDLELAGWRDGYFSDEEEPDVCEHIRAARPDMLFVAMGSPKKEYFLGRHADSLGVPFVMGVGGAVDVAAGHTRRAPAFWQRIGLEWLYRMLQEPRRLGRRYLTTNAAFVGLVVRELLTRRGARRSRVVVEQTSV